MLKWLTGNQTKGNQREMSATERLTRDLNLFKSSVEKEIEKLLKAPSGSGDSMESYGDRYKFTHPRRGLAVIINNEEFGYVKNLGDRDGSSHDAAKLFSTFSSLGFQVLHCKNLTAARIVIFLQTVAQKYDHLNSDCFACSILSHGDETVKDDVRKDILYGVDGEVVATDFIMQIFSDDFCKSLVGKPRLFFFQACRGNALDDGIDISIVPTELYSTASSGEVLIEKRKLVSSSVDPPDLKKIRRDEMEARDDRQAAEPIRIVVTPAPLYKDSLVMYATPPGYFAWRRGTGSWFIQALCEVLCSNAVKSGSIDLQKALTNVTRIVAFDYESNMPGNKRYHQRKESPVLYSMLVKDIYFNNRLVEAMDM